MKPVILFRKDRYSEEELEIAKQYFQVYENRTCCHNNLVVGRYSVLPFYKELETDLALNGCKLINNFAQHSWIANFEYYETLKAFTPESWYSLAHTDYAGPFIVKGITNSRKHDWANSMFAKDREAALNVARQLNNDAFIGTQELIYRRYIPLKVLEIGLNGLPFSNEWRIFCYKNKILSYGYYWSSAQDETINRAILDKEGLKIAQAIANIACRFVNFYVLDIAETESGDWILIEVNDGQMSGLSENSASALYRNLSASLGDELESTTY